MSEWVNEEKNIKCKMKIVKCKMIKMATGFWLLATGKKTGWVDE